MNLFGYLMVFSLHSSSLIKFFTENCTSSWKTISAKMLDCSTSSKKLNWVSFSKQDLPYTYGSRL